MGSMKRLILAKYADMNQKQDPQEAMRSYFEGGKLSYSQPQRFRLYQRDKSVQIKRLDNFKTNFRQPGLVAAPLLQRRCQTRQGGSRLRSHSRNQ